MQPPASRVRPSRLRGISGESAGRRAGRRARPRSRTPRHCRRLRPDRSHRGPQSPCHPIGATERPGAVRPQKADPRERPRKPNFDPQTPVPSFRFDPVRLRRSIPGRCDPSGCEALHPERPCRLQGPPGGKAPEKGCATAPTMLRAVGRCKRVTGAATKGPAKGLQTPLIWGFRRRCASAIGVTVAGCNSSCLRDCFC